MRKTFLAIISIMLVSGCTWQSINISQVPKQEQGDVIKMDDSKPYLTNQIAVHTSIGGAVDDISQGDFSSVKVSTSITDDSTKEGVYGEITSEGETSLSSGGFSATVGAYVEESDADNARPCFIKYVDGGFSLNGEYQTPDGSQKIHVEMTLVCEKVKNLKIKPLADNEAERIKQQKFSDEITELVLNRHLDEIHDIPGFKGDKNVMNGYLNAVEKIKNLSLN